MPGKKVSIALIALLLSSCTPKVDVHFSSTLYLPHTYSVCIKPQDSPSRAFVQELEEVLIWEQYLYVANDCEDADTILEVKAHKENHSSCTITITAKNPRSKPQTLTIKVKNQPCLKAAKIVGYHLRDALELPPEVDSATCYQDPGDPQDSSP